MMRLETLIELESLNSSFSSSDFQFERFELVLLLGLEEQLSDERFEASRAIRGGAISVRGAPPLLVAGDVERWLPRVGARC
jgi:hypothetical protein